MNMKIISSGSLLLDKSKLTKWLMVSLQRSYCSNSSVQPLSEATVKNDDLGAMVQNYLTFCPLKEIMNTLPPESNALSPSDTLNIFRQLSTTSKIHRKINPSSVVEHEKYAVLRQAIKASILYLRTEEKLDILSAIQILSVPGDDDVCHTIHSSVLENILNLSLKEIMMLDTIMTKGELNPLARELQHNLVDRFNEKTSLCPVRFNYFRQIRRMLKFIGRNRNRIRPEVFVNMQKSAETGNIDICTSYEAMEIMIVLSTFGDRCVYFKTVLEKAFDVWHTGYVSMKMVETVFDYLHSRQKTQLEMYRNDKFIKKCAEVVMECSDVEKGLAIQKKFNRLRFTNTCLTDHLLNYLVNSQSDDLFVENCITLCYACVNANHTAPLLYEFVEPNIKKMKVHQIYDRKLNWPRFARKLQKLGIYHKELIDEILQQEIQCNDEESVADLEYLRAINGHQNSMVDLRKILVDDQMRLFVYGDCGSCTKLLFKIDVHLREFVSLGHVDLSGANANHCDENQYLVAVDTLASQVENSPKSDVLSIEMDSEEWTELLRHKTKDALFLDIFDRVQSQIVYYNSKSKTNQ